jgi:hypothetical protein
MRERLDVAVAGGGNRWTAGGDQNQEQGSHGFGGRGGDRPAPGV